jgi:hypothetical protein
MNGSKQLMKICPDLSNGTRVRRLRAKGGERRAESERQKEEEGAEQRAEGEGQE